MNPVNKLPMALAMLGLGTATSFAEIKINDNLSTSGFVDMSVSGAKAKNVDATLNGSLDQYELDFMYKFGYFSARADVNGGPATGGSSISLEQAFITATLTNSLSLGLGKFLSCTGFEAAEPTGMYQYSYSKNMDKTSPTGMIYGGYSNGVNINFSTPTFGIYAAALTDVWSGAETEYMKTPGGEFQVSLMPVEGVTAKAAFAYQVYDADADTVNKDEGQGLANVWAQYAKGPITVAAEFNYLMGWASKNPAQKNDATGMGWLGMANYKFTDKFAATVRYSATTLDDEDNSTEDMGSEVTLSPSLAISPNWLVLAEVKQEFGNVEQTAYGIESTFIF